MTVRIINADVMDGLRQLPDESVHCVVTSPPYWGLRDYGVDGQIGREASASEHVAAMVSVFSDLRRVLRSDGVMWLNYGDSWASKGWRAHAAKAGTPAGWDSERRGSDAINTVGEGIKERDLIGMAWTLALALRADGWWLRDAIVWNKPNPMPSSVPNRCCPAHEYLFMLTKAGSGYYYDGDAIAEPITEVSAARLSQSTIARQQGGEKQRAYAEGQTGQRAKSRKPADILKALAKKKNEASGDRRKEGFNARWDDAEAGGDTPMMRKRRSVWTIPVGDFSEAHFATFPVALVEPCVLAGCPKGGTVLDPFGGAGTTGLVADRLQRHAILIELNPEYAAMSQRRVDGDRGGLLDLMEATA